MPLAAGADERSRGATREARHDERETERLGATNARGVGREQRGNLRGGCMSKLCVE